MRLAVVGGGLGGLSAALAFHRLGIEVRCFEQAEALGEMGAGISLAPNGIRVLRHLGVGDAVHRLGARISDRIVCLADGTVVHAKSCLRPSAHDYQYGMHRADLVEILSEALPADVVVLGHRCTGLEQRSNAATVHFANGHSYTADLVVAADGMHSVLQRYMTPPAMPVHSGTTAYRGTLSSDAVGWPPGRFQLWMGPGKHFLAYPLRANRLVNYVGFVATAEEARESWSSPGDPRALSAEFAGFDEKVTSMIDAIDVTFTWGLYDRDPLPRWTSGRLALLGDAAHPMLPHAGQGVNQALEDAVTVATLVARAGPACIPEALDAYAELRQGRTARIQRYSRASGLRFDSAGEDRRAARSPGEKDLGWLHDHDALALAEQRAARMGSTRAPRSVGG